MEIALISNDSLILGPIGFNVRMINSELEGLELEERISTSSYTEVPIHFSDNSTHILPIEKLVQSYDSKYYDIGNLTWNIIKENEIPVKVVFEYPLISKSLEEIKEIRKQEVKLIRKQKQNTTINLTIGDTEIQVSTSIEERTSLSNKLSVADTPYNYKFNDVWVVITKLELQVILNSIDIVVQGAFDWEFNKTQEIDNCNTIEEVYNVVIQQTI
jgi:hypothetical protein